jgi:hypothetical protein
LVSNLLASSVWAPGTDEDGEISPLTHFHWWILSSLCGLKWNRCEQLCGWPWILGRAFPGLKDWFIG